MARVITSGFEVVVATVASCDIPNGGAGTITRDTSSQRTGTGCLKCDSTGSNLAATISLLSLYAASTTYYLRGYFRFTDLPTSSARLVGSANNAISARVTSAGKLQLWNDATAQVGSDSAATISTGSTYYRIELQLVTNGSSQISATELRLDGTTVASTSGLTISTGKLSLSMGWVTAPGASKVCFVDDVAMNTGAGAANNTWPGDGAAVMLLPVSDDSVDASWKLGTGTAISSNAYDSVNNAPPLAVADLTAGSDPKQVRNASSVGNAQLQVLTQSYTAAGVPSGATVNVVTPWVCTAAPVATSAKLGFSGCAANPLISAQDFAAGGTAAAFWSGVAAGTYPTGWKWSPGIVTNTPSVTLGSGTTPYAMQGTSSTRIAMVCFIGMYVDFTPAAVAAAIPDIGMAMTVT